MAAPPHTVTGDGGFNWKRGENNLAENANSPGGRQRQTRQWRSVRMTNELQGQRRVNASCSRINSPESWRTAADAPKKLKLSKKIIHRCIIAAFPVMFCLLSFTFSLPTVFSSTAPSLHIFLELCPNSSFDEWSRHRNGPLL